MQKKGRFCGLAFYTKTKSFLLIFLLLLLHSSILPLIMMLRWNFIIIVCVFIQVDVEQVQRICTCFCYSFSFHLDTREEVIQSRIWRVNLSMSTNLLQNNFRIILFDNTVTQYYYHHLLHENNETAYSDTNFLLQSFLSSGLDWITDTIPHHT